MNTPSQSSAEHTFLETIVSEEERNADLRNDTDGSVEAYYDDLDVAHKKAVETLNASRGNVSDAVSKVLESNVVPLNPEDAYVATDDLPHDDAGNNVSAYPNAWV